MEGLTPASADDLPPLGELIAESARIGTRHHRSRQRHRHCGRARHRRPPASAPATHALAAVLFPGTRRHAAAARAGPRRPATRPSSAAEGGQVEQAGPVTNAPAVIEVRREMEGHGPILPPRRPAGQGARQPRRDRDDVRGETVAIATVAAAAGRARAAPSRRAFPRRRPVTPENRCTQVRRSPHHGGRDHFRPGRSAARGGRRRRRPRSGLPAAAGDRRR